MKLNISVFPYNGDQYLKNVAFNRKKNRGIERTIFLTLKDYLNEKDIEVFTYDVAGERKIFKYVYFDIPYPWNFKVWKTIIRNRRKNALICNESALIIPFNYWRVLHFFFAKIFTWYEPLVDNKKYKKFLLPKSSQGIEIKPKNFKSKKFLVYVNKNVGPFFIFDLIKSFGKEIYSERLRAVEYFEKKMPNDFYFYGRGWNKPKKHSISERLFGYKRYKSYKGEAEDKVNLLSGFKFSICFENLTDVNGYVTEKIFDCLKAKCVPVYLGASDIEKYIPRNCFIDFREFRDYDDLLNFLKSIDEEKYGEYMKNIEKLLSNEKFRKTWFEDQFARFFYKEILGLKK